VSSVQVWTFGAEAGMSQQHAPSMLPDSDVETIDGPPLLHCDGNASVGAYPVLPAQACRHHGMRQLAVCMCVCMTSICFWFWEVRPHLLHSDREVVQLAEMAQIEAPPAYCCASASSCIVGTRESICCATSTPILCGKGSMGYMNSLGMPFCCALNSTGCDDMCVDKSMALALQQYNGKPCNGIVPQGFKFWEMSRDFVMTVNAPWDDRARRYNFDGNTSASINSPIVFGTRAFVLEFVLTPKSENLVPPGQELACVLSKVEKNQVRMRGDAWVGLRACFTSFHDTLLDVSINDGGLTSVGTRIAGFDHISRDVPISIRVLFNETDVTSWVNGKFSSERIPASRARTPWDNSVPLVLGAEATHDVPGQHRYFLNAYLSDLQLGTYEELPDINQREELPDNTQRYIKRR